MGREEEKVFYDSLSRVLAVDLIHAGCICRSAGHEVGVAEKLQGLKEIKCHTHAWCVLFILGDFESGTGRYFICLLILARAQPPVSNLWALSTRADLWSSCL